METVSVRKSALNILNRIVYQHGYASLILRSTQTDYDERDQALLSEIVYGTMRNLQYLEYQWQPLAKRPVQHRTSLLLDMSVYQLLFLDRIPSYAVVDEAVDLAEERDKKFVNAVLRSVQRQEVRTVDKKDILEKTAVMTSHPLWLLKLWGSHYGIETAVKIAEHDQKSAVVYGRVNTLKCSIEKAASFPGVYMLEDGCFTYDGILSGTKMMKNGLVLIQDRASQKVARFLDAKPGMSVLDCCAAPGTKTIQVAALMNNTGSITACDQTETRVKLIQDLCRRTGVKNCSAIIRDASRPDGSLKEKSFDRILVDAPCSGLGDLSHKPEIRLHITPQDIDTLCELQRKILNTSAMYLKKDGILVYSTCTLNKKENENQIQKFLKQNPDFRLNAEKTCFPFEEDSDGFYMAQLQRID